MFLIDAPYVSDFLKQSLVDIQAPVIKTAYSEKSLQGYEINFISEEQAIRNYTKNPELQFHTNSENALNWITHHFPSSDLADSIASVKDKIQFREVLKNIHPNYFYQGCKYADLTDIEAGKLPYPIILKPAVGFFSLGVQRLDNEKQWNHNLTELAGVNASYEGIYPLGVLDSSVFVIESVIPGDEFAVDCYYDDQGEVVILNMMKHLFASGSDVNDRVYITSSGIMKTYLSQVQNYLNTLGNLLGLKNFQAHIEIRIDGSDIAAIEINPLRFGGWCSTADLAKYAWGMNLYKAVVGGLKPDWGELIKRDPEHIYALIVLNNSTGLSGHEIQGFDYSALLKTVQEPLELRKTDFKNFPLFGFLMCRAPLGEMKDLQRLLHSNLSEFILSDQSG